MISFKVKQLLEQNGQNLETRVIIEKFDFLREL